MQWSFRTRSEGSGIRVAFAISFLTFGFRCGLSCRLRGAENRDYIYSGILWLVQRSALYSKVGVCHQRVNFGGGLYCKASQQGDMSPLPDM